MPRGIRARPIIYVWIGDVINIPLEFYDNGEKITPIPAIGMEVSAAFEGANKFTRTLLISEGEWTLPAEDLFDAEGDWVCNVTRTEESETIIGEEFIFRVQTPAPKAAS